MEDQSGGGGSPPRDITRLLNAIEAGEDRAAQELLPVVYQELRHLAAHHMAGEAAGHTLQPTALVHEACLRLLDHRRIEWQGRTHLLALAATLMRQILVSHARKRHAAKRGGGAAVTLAEDHAVRDAPAVEVLALHHALDRLESLDPRQARVVELRYFGGLTIEETADALAVSPATVKTDWSLARAWLFTQLEA
jgi:RNA polymerase sigma factor (TIGR02999 family)